ncbi:hypothetical protein [Actinocrispum sp. NPDC049592]|uniref:hypothetical protein n=1 Tax=Actinocrispum sp. NPDC049592 TaxID=3154835 RepID=UPI003418126D
MQIADGGGGGPVIAAQSIFDSVNAFANTAASGAIEISEEGGNNLIQVIRQFRQWVADQGNDLDQLSQTRKLGETYGAKAMTPFIHQVVTDGQGFVTQLRALSDSLAKAEEGIGKAMENYRATEEANKSKANIIEV